MELKSTDVTGQVIQAFYAVYNALGYGFLEKVYENAMAIELRHLGLHVVAQAGIDVYYGDAHIGQYSADLLVNDQVLVELKAARALLGTETSPGPLTAVSVGAALVLLVSGAYYFRRMEKTFADVV